MDSPVRSRYPMRRLCDVGVRLLDCEHRAPRAASAGYPYIAAPNLREVRLNLTEVRLISRAGFLSWTRRTKPRAGDVTVSRRARVGDTAVVPAGLECAIGQNLVILRADGTQVDQRYLRWALRGPLYDQQVQRYLHVGAVFDSLNCSDIPKFEIPVPPLSMQKDIAGVLDALNEKIEVNCRMNETLEPMAQAIFMSWFVHFDPVRARAEGRQPACMDAETAGLFPEGFEDSEIGRYPRDGRSVGWTRSSRSRTAWPCRTTRRRAMSICP